MDGHLKVDQSIKGKTSSVEVLALKRSNEGWAVESLHYLWQGAAETQWASRSNFFCTRIKTILGAKAAQMGLPGAGQGRDLHQEGV